jgi:beta-xylosidase
MSIPGRAVGVPRGLRPELLGLEGDISPIHDPAIIRQGGTYYLFASNRFAQKLVPMLCSPDRRRLTLCGNVFDDVPEWSLQEVPGARGIWAPDIAFFRGKYHLYYSVSTFGKNRSVIGLTTTARSIRPMTARPAGPRSRSPPWSGRTVGRVWDA